MGQYVAGAFALVLLAITTATGMGAAGAFAARAALASITQLAASDMGVAGGYTAQVQAAIQTALTQHGLQPALASVAVNVDNGNATNTALYGQTYTVWLTYDLPVGLLGGAITVPITTSAPGISTYPCSSSACAPASIPGGAL